MNTKILSFLLIPGLALASGCDIEDVGAQSTTSHAAQSPTPPCAPLAPIDSFVWRDGPQLMLNDRPFRAVGANLYYLQQLFAYGEGGNTALAKPALEALDSAVCMQLPVVRAWGFNDTTDTSTIRPEPGVYRRNGLRGLDRVVAEAKARGLRVILTLTNNWGDYGGISKYAEWAGRGPGGGDAFFSDRTMQGYWKDYVTMLASRVNEYTGVAYRDEPTILAWEIGNEFRCQSCARTTRLVDTVRELARHLKSVMPYHLVSDGGEGMDDVPSLYPGLSNKYAVSGFEGASYSKLLQVEELDILSYHMYPADWGLNTGKDVRVWLDSHEFLAAISGKVSYLGEFGHKPAEADVARRDDLRASMYDTWLARLLDHDGANLGMVWQLIPMSRLETDDGFGVLYGLHGRTVSVLSKWARMVR
jgi:mannan endo-1,4-beta-mannosidase